MLNKIHEILRDPQCSFNIKSLAWSFAFVIFWICLLLGMFIFSDYSSTYKHFNSRLRILENKQQVIIKIVKENQSINENIMPACLKGRK